MTLGDLLMSCKQWAALNQMYTRIPILIRVPMDSEILPWISWDILRPASGFIDVVILQARPTLAQLHCILNLFFNKYLARVSLHKVVFGYIPFISIYPVPFHC